MLIARVLTSGSRHSVDEIMAWRKWLSENNVQQPFKQAHREIYLLTEAERRTGIYSNRFAAHIIKQHQFNSLCAVRRWKNSMKLIYEDDAWPSSLSLPKWKIIAEFWTDGLRDGVGEESNETGILYYLSTDQVRFLPMAEEEADGTAPDNNHLQTPEAIPLEEIPPLVFSEVMRDVDLFVGVASVGNDPTWSDGGPDGMYRNYWSRYSFGNLSATAETRKELLMELIPRLKIKDRCSFDDKFLIVRGDIRTYKIHIGSGNILMSPNDQYLCIVPGRNTARGTSGIFLPFEGDATLSIILSKAFLLAEDTKITDQTIVNQIKA